MIEQSETAFETLQRSAHPWHGVNPELKDGRLNVYIENVQFDVMKYEIDKASGLLKIDQPFQTSALPPCAYGFVPRTLCGTRVANLAKGQRGDQAPLDVFVLSERPISIPGVLARVRILGGMPTRDENRVDDKLITVLERDPSLSGINNIGDLPIHLLERISHFLCNTALDTAVEVGDPFDGPQAQKVLLAAMDDYLDTYSDDHS